MTVHEYLEETLLLLTVSATVESFRIVTRKETESDGYIRVRAILIDGHLFEASIYCQATEDSVQVIDYRFHWQHKDGKLIKRWDTARHHPELKSFPMHVHVGDEEHVKESAPVDIKDILQILESGLEGRWF